MPSDPTPKSLGYVWPAEWETHAATWISWPHNRKTWPGKFEPIPRLFADVVHMISQYEPVHVLAAGEAYDNAVGLLPESPEIILHQIPTNDCWIRDHGPWFLQHPSEPPALVNWRYNAWGEKYPPFQDDDAAPRAIAETLSMKCFSPKLVMEGGSVENNGNGTLLVTSQCLLNPNRNPGVSQTDISEALCEYAGAEKVCWLFDSEDGSIAGDDTDAHIDQLARFVSSERIIATECKDSLHPDYEIQTQLQRQLDEMTGAHGERFDVILFPQPEPVHFEEHQLPASYMNYYLGNGFVILPQFGCPQDEQAVSLMQNIYMDREVIPVDAVDLIWGLGAFHCATMQQGTARP